MRASPFLPINIEEWDELDTAIHLYTGEMNRDFGPWRGVADYRPSLVFNFVDGTVTEYGEGGEVKYKFELIISLGKEIKE